MEWYHFGVLNGKHITCAQARVGAFSETEFP